MKNSKRILSLLLAVAALTAMLLTGCSAPKLEIGGTPSVAGTVGGKELPTGEYLAYLYNAFYDMYYNQGLYQYEAYNYDAWGQEFDYGEGEDVQTVKLDEYIKLTAKDSILRQAVLDDMLAENELTWDAEDLKTVEKNLEEVGKDAYLPVGISDQHFASVYKKLSLNEAGVFYGLYDKGGKREVSEADRKAYFQKNYLSYKMISIALTDDEGSELDEAGKKKITDQLGGYLKSYNKDKNFEAVVDAYNKTQAAEGETVEPTKDEDNRINVDATQMDDDELVKAVRSVPVGQAKVVTYKAGGTTNTAALILRLDINSPATLYTDEQENILYGMKWEDFDKEVKAAMEKKPLELKKSVVKKCNPKNFVTDIQ